MRIEKKEIVDALEELIEDYKSFLRKDLAWDDDGWKEKMTFLGFYQWLSISSNSD